MARVCLAISAVVAIALAIHAAFPTHARQLSERDELIANKQAVHAYISSVLADRRSRAADASPGSRGTRGIVYPAGGKKQLANAWVSISILRHHHGCTLPIELVYNGESEMPHNLKSILKVSTMLLLPHLALLAAVATSALPLTFMRKSQGRLENLSYLIISPCSHDSDTCPELPSQSKEPLGACDQCKCLPGRPLTRE